MEVLGCCKCVGVVILMGVWRLSFISAQPGFLSIDCGAETNRTDPETNITWVTDDNYLIANAGVKLNINDSTAPFYLQSARVFPMPINKSCYELPLTPDVPHLLRVWFHAGTFNGLQQIPRFDFSIETVDLLSMANIPFEYQQTPRRGERVLVSSGQVLYICMIRNADDDNLFISAIELRTLQKGMYDVAKPGQMLRMLGRYDIGAQSTTRYPQDRFDRMWDPFSIGGGAENVSLVEPISTINTRNLPPSTVMQTAAVTNNRSMYIPLQQYQFPEIGNYFLLLLYFAEIEQSSGSESRIFNISINNEISLSNISLQRDFSAREVAFASETPDLSFMLQRDSASTRGPIINAFERYQMLLTEPATSSMDAQALAAVKKRFNIKNWISDPCFVVPWEGIQCTNISSTVRVSEINLSGRNLTGSIPPAVAQLTELVHMSLENNHLTGALPNLSSLTKLEGLYLQNNRLSGRVPDWLSQLHNLKELVIENNNFSGVIPQQLLDLPSLEIRYRGNFYLCMNKGECLRSSHSKGNRVSVIIGAIASGFAMICVAFIVCTVRHRKKKLKRATAGRFPDYSMIMVPNTSKSRAFSLDEMKISTENFSHNIGQGGFGSVFWGKLRDEKQIAVKVLSLFSKQGVSQFLNEIDLLSRVHHRNLVSLLGYCNESRDLMLVYEYMPRGSLNNHLYGSNPLKYPELDWKTRLKIALDAAQGLEYLHVGSTPKIIHRDVKTANILLDNNLNGKLADFGLSRVAMDEEASHISTGVRGTAGYLDPKYFSTHMLTDKSDVYSFGVVLLEIICGRRPVDFKQSEDKVDLVKWVTPYAKQFEDFVEILEIVDKRLVTNYNMKSISKVAKLAMRCIAEEPSYRPTVSEVVMEIKEAINYENDKNATTFIDVSEEINNATTFIDVSEEINNATTFIDVSEEISIEYADLDSRHVSTTESNEHSSETSSVKQLKSAGHHHD